MKKLSVWAGPAGLALFALLLLAAAPAKEDRLWRHRNLGKAFYENPTTGAQAVEEFRKALELSPDSVRERVNYGLALLKAGDPKAGIAELEKAQKQDPKIPHTWFNLGIAYKREGRYDDAIRQFQQMIRLVPDEPVSHYNLGLLYNLTGNERLAMEQFRIASRLDPKLVAPLFQIYNMYRLAGREADAARALELFQEAKKRQKANDESEDMEWSAYSEIYDPHMPKPPADADNTPLRFEDRKLAGTVDPATAGLAVLDLEGNGHIALVAWSRSGIRIYKNGLIPVSAPELPSGIVSVAPGDFDNDGLPDLCVLTGSAAILFRNHNGTFRKHAEFATKGRMHRALWLDYDHDYDLDLFLLGSDSMLIRNEGAGGFHQHEFPFVPGEVIDAAPFRLMADGKGFDFIAAYHDHAGVLYRDQLGGKYVSVPLPVLPSGATNLRTFDIDNDAWLDLAFAGPNGVALLMNRRGRLEPAATAAKDAPAFPDLLNRGVGDLVAGGSVFRNRGLGRLGAAETPGLPDAIAWAVADFDGDGRTDLAAVAPDGSIHLLTNKSGGNNAWLRVALSGVKNIRTAAGSEVEVKAGEHYQKQLYEGVPLVFGLGPYREADTVRITWPNGMIQNQTSQPAGQSFAYKEAPRLSGSCPTIFAWNGKEFQFITDVLGVAPLGASSGNGEYFPVDHQEYVQIPGEALTPVNGNYEIRITEELREVSYLDQVRLIAVDHPAGVDIVTNEKFKSPPFPEFRLFGMAVREYPVRAADDHGRNVLPRLLRRDGTYPDAFRRNSAGVAELHSLDLDFGPQAADGNRALLVLHGWVDWADGSTFLGAAQEGKGGLILPYLQVKDARGEWRTVIDDMGIPAGKPKTIAVDLSGKFLSASREIRIVTNLCVYWDEIFLTEDAAARGVRLTDLPPQSANLRFRGFSRAIIHPERKQPEMFEYAHVSPVSRWNPTPGLYTRYGPVTELIRSVDDRLVIMGSGDELRLMFDGTQAPPLPPGWKRDFLLMADGWAKDGDANTAFSQTVEPLPFHAMSRYPYPASEHYPADRQHNEYRAEYNRRPALRLIQPLCEKFAGPLADARGSEARPCIRQQLPSRDCQAAVLSNDFGEERKP